MLALTLPVSAEPPAPGQVQASPKPAKRLQRDPQLLGAVDDHPCTREMKYRQADYLSQLTDSARLQLVAQARGGDAGSMYLLAQIPLQLPSGALEFPYRNIWLPRATEAGHPVARYELATLAHRDGHLTDADFLSIVEEAARWQASGDIAWRLAFSYLEPDAEKSDVLVPIPRNFQFLAGDAAKGRYWARLAAEKGNVMAAERLCIAHTAGETARAEAVPKSEAEEAFRWCMFAAQALCSSTGASRLSQLYERGVGVQRSPVDALVWRRIAEERWHRNAEAIGRWDYVGGPER